VASVLAFDIETIPDIGGLRVLRGADPALTDAEVYAAEIADRAARNKSDFMPLHLQRVLVVSCVFRSAQGLQVRSFVDRETGGKSQEREVIQEFFSRIERFHPQLVSWNGGGFDLPVLQQRGLRHGVVAGKYWDMGDDDREYRYNSYISRYHLRHIDLMDLLAMYQVRGNAPLDAMAKLCGFPGKLGMDGSQVYPAYREGKTDEIRRYCETDAMNTYLLWCRFEKMRGRLDERGYAREMLAVRDTIAGLDEAHWSEYLAAWPPEDEPPVALPSTSAEPLALTDPSPVAGPDAATGSDAPAVVVETTTTTIYIDSSSIRA
jgi:predicted PolB exonuclease-like 3'-5' exonuclease